MAINEVSASALREQFFARFAPVVVDAIARLMSQQGDVYAVGGVVRDLILGRDLKDIDLTTEADAIERVRAAFPHERITTHARFRTASVIVDGTHIDISTARRERYERPGALPDIERASIEEDLLRRDFSINAMALRLTGEAALLDPCEGLADLGRGAIRVLHDASFQDDATRILRACRYAARLGFQVESATLDLVRRDVDAIAHVSGARLRRELELTFIEDAGADALTIAQDLGALGAIHAELSWDTPRSQAFKTRAVDVPATSLGFALLSAGVKRDTAEAIIDRIKLRRNDAVAVRALASMADTAATLRRAEAKPSGVTVLLDRYPVAAVAAFAATTGDPIAAQVALRYLAEWRFAQPLLHGDDLLALGVPAGPQVQRGLKLLRAARLDGWAEDEGDERALALRFAKSVRDSAGMHADVELHVNGH
jgi:tRNA nucleotidyltransferase (CCA-adding enzyme)